MTTTTGGANNLAARLEHQRPGPALVLGDRVVSHQDLADRVARWRGGLLQAGVTAGDRVAIVAPAGEAMVAAHLAVMGLGAVSVPLNPDCPAGELARELDAAGTGVIFADGSGVEALDAALAVVGPALATDLVRLDPSELDRADAAPLADVEPDQVAVLLFTSGTAGPPQPAMLTHGNLTAALQSILSMPTGLLERPQTFLGVVPLFHVLGLNVVLHLALALGGSIVLAPFPGAEATIDLIERHEVTVALGPPNLWAALAAVPNVDPERLASVRLALSGAAPLPGQVKMAVTSRLGLRLDEGYGLTESGAVVSSTVATEAPAGSIGRLAPGVEARIVDDDGVDCLVGDPGELWVRGDMVFPGYWRGDRGPDRAPLTEDGWLRTGDLAAVDEQGHLSIVGRIKDLIIVSGFNVYPGEVESVLVQHPDVADAGVVGEPSPATGEAVVAFVVPAAGRAIDEDGLIEHCRSELARYKVPNRIVVAPDLPIGPTGKLQRVRLR
ncbi:MAG: AMP-binding protein [Actinomycetota bacterium]